MGNGLRDVKNVLREGAGMLETVKKRQMKQSGYAKELGLDDPYAGKKKKKKKEAGGIRSFMDKFISSKQPKD